MSSSFSNGFSLGWRQGHAHSALESQRFAILNKPPAPNPPELLVPTKCRVLKAFGLGGGVVAVPGTVVTLPKFDAESLAASRRVEIIP